MCLNPALAIHSRDKPPPLYICSDCADVLQKDHSDYMMDILLPMSHVSTKCENKVRWEPNESGPGWSKHHLLDKIISSGTVESSITHKLSVLILVFC